MGFERSQRDKNRREPVNKNRVAPVPHLPLSNMGYPEIDAGTFEPCGDTSIRRQPRTHNLG